MQVTLVHLLRAYSFQLGPGQIPLKLRTGALTGPADGLHMRVVPRK